MGIVNVANVLTVVRIFLVPVFVFCLVQGGTGWRLGALAAFGGASFTDFLDGQLARKRGLVTDFGKIADPIADKALTGAALITLSVLGELPWWVTGLILARELGITALRFAVIRRGVIAASQGGKLKTLLQIIAICLYVLPISLGAARRGQGGCHGRGPRGNAGDGSGLRSTRGTDEQDPTRQARRCQDGGLPRGHSVPWGRPRPRWASWDTPDPDGPYLPMPAQAAPDRKTRDRIRPALRRLKLRG